MSTEPLQRGNPENYGIATGDGRQIFPLVFTLLLLVFFLLGFFSVYFCRYVSSITWFHHHRVNATTMTYSPHSPPHGLHPSVVSSFPTFTYALVKNHREEKSCLECAICLSEFNDDDVLRLLTLCNHAFHPECVDPWFESHTTCPVCRHNLEPLEMYPVKLSNVGTSLTEAGPREESMEEVALEEGSQRRVSFKVEEGRRGEVGSSTNSFNSVDTRRKDHIVMVDLLRRSHSTGHSMASDDRFTLKLPEKVKQRIERERERRWTDGSISFRDSLKDRGTLKPELSLDEGVEGK